MKKVLALITSAILATSILAGCSSTTATKTDEKKDSDKITVVWYPNESGEDLKDCRAEFGKIIEKATGKKVEHKTTTDYSIAIETIANNNAAIAFMGAQGYVEAHNKNAKIMPLAVQSGKSGTLDDAIYYSWLAVNKGQEGEYKDGDKFKLDKIQGKKISFVSNSSTSGFKVPTQNIVTYFNKTDKWKDLKKDDLLQGGKDKFFQEVLFGGSHQGSAANLLTNKADVAAFCDTTLENYVELADGKANTAGATYRIKNDAADPFASLHGKEYVVISSTPVLNGPFAMNTSVLTDKEQKSIQDAFLSDDVTNNEKIFVPKNSKFKGLIQKEGKEKFLKAEDSWFNPIRDLSK